MICFVCLYNRVTGVTKGYKIFLSAYHPEGRILFWEKAVKDETYF
jgi:hypothetical protein